MSIEIENKIHEDFKSFCEKEKYPDKMPNWIHEETYDDYADAFACGFYVAALPLHQKIDELWKNNNSYAIRDLKQREKIAELEQALLKRNKQIGVACLKHDLRHDLECGVCFKEIQSQLAKAEKVIEFYADTEKYRRPKRDRNGMGGMSAMTDFELDDGEWKIDENGHKDHYCYGKRAREYQAKYGGRG